MKDLQNPQNKKNIKYSSLVLFSILCVVLVFMYNMIGLVEKSHETKKKKNAIATQIDSLTERETNLQNNIDKLNSTIGTEEAIRDKYQMVKPGEKMVVIVDENKDIDIANPEINTKNNSKGFIGFLKNLFN